MSRKFASLFAAIAIGIVSVSPASAERSVRISQVAVSYGDLDLTRAEGVKTLTFRLKSAVTRVCGRSESSASLMLRRKINACRETAMSNAVAAVNAPSMTAYYEGREGAQFARN